MKYFINEETGEDFTFEDNVAATWFAHLKPCKPRPSEYHIWHKNTSTWILDDVLKKTTVMNTKLITRDKYIENSMWILERHRQECELVVIGIISKTTLTVNEYNSVMTQIQNLRDLGDEIRKNPLSTSVPEIIIINETE